MPNGDWLAGTRPDAATAQLVAVSISPSGNTVAVADQGNRAIVVFSPDNPPDIQAFAVPCGTGSQPAGLAVTDQGLVYFLLSGSGSCLKNAFWQLDKTTGVIQDLGLSSGWSADPQNRVLLSSNGSRVYIDADGMLKVYSPGSVAVEFVELAYPKSDMALSKDDVRLIQQSAVITQDGDVLGTPLETETEASDTFNWRYGQKLDRHGSLMLQPWSTSLDLNDLGHFQVRKRIALNVQVQDVYDSLVWDDDDDRAFLIVNGGVLELPVPLPLVLSSTLPNSLPLIGGSVQLFGAGFTSDTTATLDGQSLPVTFSDATALVLQAPAHVEGAVQIKLTRGDGQITFLDVPLYSSNSTGQQQGQQSRAKNIVSRHQGLRSIPRSQPHRQ